MSHENIPLAVGEHVLGELSGVSAEYLNDEVFLRSVFEKVLKLAGTTVCNIVSKHFEPQGVTVLALLAESHASIHTYPEFGSLFVDVFTCGNRAKPQEALRLLIEELQPVLVNIRSIARIAQPLVLEAAYD